MITYEKACRKPGDSRRLKKTNKKNEKLFFCKHIEEITCVRWLQFAIVLAGRHATNSQRAVQFVGRTGWQRHSVNRTVLTTSRASVSISCQASVQRSAGDTRCQPTTWASSAHRPEHAASSCLRDVCLRQVCKFICFLLVSRSADKTVDDIKWVQ